MALKEITIPGDFTGKRVSDCVRALLPDLPESAIRRIFAARDVKLDGVRVAREHPVQECQTLSVYLPAGRADVSSVPALSVIYEDDDVLLVNKRAGISVEPDARGGRTLSDLCAAHTARQAPDAFPPAAATGWTTGPAGSVSLRRIRSRWRSCRMFSAAGIWKSIMSAWSAAS